MGNHMKPINTATFTQEVTVTDPRYNSEVALAVFVHDQSGGMFAIDSSYLVESFPDNIDPVIDDPFNAGQLVKLLGL